MIKWALFYSSAHDKCPPNFNPQYLTLIFTKTRVQYHFQTLLSILFPMVPNFAWFDEEKVKLEQI